MKKTLSILFVSLMLIFPFAARLWSTTNLPIFTGDLTKVEYRVIAEDNDVIIIVVDGQEFIIKTQK